MNQFFQAELAKLGHECAALLYLGLRFQPIRYIEQGSCALSHPSVCSREIVRTAPLLNAAAIIISGLGLLRDDYPYPYQ